MEISLSGHQIWTAVAVSLATGLYVVKRYYAGGVCRSRASLEGKVVIVTGANCGIGREAAQDFARRGGRVILACRDQSRGEAAMEDIRRATGNNNVIYMHLNLASFKSIRKFTQEIITNEKSVDILVNNAGLACDRKLTEDGLEMIMGVNHFGHFLLTNLLLPKIKESASSRIVNVASSVYAFVKSINFDDIQNEKNFNNFNVYSQSKLANILFTRSLAKKLKDTHVTVNALHPGAVRTEIWRGVNILKYFWARLVIYPIAFIFFKSSYEGAQTTIHLAVSEEVERITGQYFVDCQIKKLQDHALDEEAGNKLWDISEELTGLK
ncbi:uncharacterized protein TRIADDRAFT_32037 [Trichoplax adhaerens]|uniref:Uncharacterized protein n=1 Tax=Trichoplax adhaerens TaxID=10228 RepID=B3SA21_TRIAD|nr:hypothetical protein TRIADDRAFT_32037 [Trichoplax adhaerens]EDV20437.1 hypothetical protein TRIADDRAFT_32037 [Trichoplax adhaerens]|eukprot:XP_002117131.1 hypothetical protein TRIADDRAFT_32037 [Trichoplax adhaerens]